MKKKSNTKATKTNTKMLLLWSVLSAILLLAAVVTIAFGLLVVAKEKTTNTEATTAGCKLKLKPRGQYNMPGFGEEFFVYHFDNPNEDIVVYWLLDTTYMVAEDSGETGTSYADAFMRESQFVALSDKYFLFLTKDGLIAVSLEEENLTIEEIRAGKDSQPKYPFDNLSEEEKAAFVYPTSYEKVLQLEGETYSR